MESQRMDVLKTRIMIANLKKKAAAWSNRSPAMEKSKEQVFMDICRKVFRGDNISDTEYKVFEPIVSRCLLKQSQCTTATNGQKAESRTETPIRKRQSTTDNGSNLLTPMPVPVPKRQRCQTEFIAVGQASTSANAKEHNTADKSVVSRNRFKTIDLTKPTKSGRAAMKNDNILMYANNPDFNKHCPHCNTKNRNLVNHIVKSHPDEEIMVSRISPAMRDRMKNGQIVSKYQKNNQQITTICPFCETDATKNITKWDEHLRIHTGEYQYKCTRCDYAFAKPDNHYKKPGCASFVKMVLPRAATSDGITGYICNNCNYVQLGKLAMQKHIRNQHNREADAYQYSRLQLVKLSENNQMDHVPEKNHRHEREISKPSGSNEQNLIQSKCSICDVSFVFNKRQWIKHLAKHTGEFDDLTTVEMDATGINGYLCSLCSATHLARDRALAHIEDYHSIDASDEFIRRILLVSLRK